jgi:ABC-type phosphate transport system permease subunit
MPEGIYTLIYSGEMLMNWAWRFGMIVLTGVPAIIGGGITYGLTESYTGVIIWEVILFLLLVAALIKGGKGDSGAHQAGAH